MAFVAVLAGNGHKAALARSDNASIRLKDIFQLLLLLAGVFQTSGAPIYNQCSCDPELCQGVDCSQNNQVIDFCTCCPVCLKGVNDRCGGLRNSAGQCQNGLRCVSRLGSIFGTFQNKIGVCEDNHCTRLSACPFRQRCMLNKTTRDPQCSCQHFRCENKYNPVCGHDNMEYLSVCRLQKQECMTGKFIGIKNRGGCQQTEAGKLQTVIPDNNINQIVPRSGGCVYENNHYNIGQMISSGMLSCTVKYCTAHETIKVINLPGCGNNPPEIDYHVEKPPVHGNWSNWSTWTQCIGSCGSTTQSRNRTCTNPSPKNEGRFCEGSNYEERDCEPASCLDPDICKGKVKSWSYWSPCSSKCGTGKRFRIRDVVSSTSTEEYQAVKDQCAEQHENCTITPCSNGSCTPKRVYDFLWVLHPDSPDIVGTYIYCRSIQKHHFTVCTGVCHSANTTLCCKPKVSQPLSSSTFFHCDPHDTTQREIVVKFPTSCECQPCDN